jgi:hypothetical protein
MLNKEFCILIPTINRADLLHEALAVYKKSFPSNIILILDNGEQHIENDNNNVFIYKEDRFGVAESWNYLIKKAAIYFDYFLILNDDIILDNAEKNISEIINNDDMRTFYVCEPHNNWSSFLLSSRVYIENGKFDENFIGCYYEDNDYAYRLILNDINIKHDSRLNPTTYRNSQTILKNPELNNSHNNKHYYITKWGGEPKDELYTRPFNLK